MVTGSMKPFTIIAAAPPRTGRATYPAEKRAGREGRP
jgi:hypothetical protein